MGKGKTSSQSGKQTCNQQQLSTGRDRQGRNDQLWLCLAEGLAPNLGLNYRCNEGYGTGRQTCMLPGQTLSASNGGTIDRQGTQAREDCIARAHQSSPSRAACTTPPADRCARRAPLPAAPSAPATCMRCSSHTFRSIASLRWGEARRDGARCGQQAQGAHMTPTYRQAGAAPLGAAARSRCMLQPRPASPAQPSPPERLQRQDGEGLLDGHPNLLDACSGSGGVGGVWGRGGGGQGGGLFGHRPLPHSWSRVACRFVDCQE